jgi:predicted alpha/beta-fold hydrolase
LKVDNGEYFLKNPGKIDMQAVAKAKNIREFDAAAVVPVAGYRDVDHYYTESSACRVSHNIMTPTLALSSADDPVCSIKGCPTTDEKLGPGLVVVQTRNGGHVSFIDGIVPSTKSWMDSVAVEWFLSDNR